MMLVSVIIPCFNVQDYILECLASVYNQSYKNIEVICIDNNSNDNTWQILITAKKNYPLLIIDKEVKVGANAARNKGLELAKGEWSQFLDADDVLFYNKIEHQIDLIHKHASCVSFIAAACIRKNIQGKEKIDLPMSQVSFAAPFINRCGITSANFWNTRKLELSGRWDESLKSSQETDLMFRIMLSGGNYLVDNEALTIIRERESGQISQSNPSEKWKQYIDVRLDYLKKLKLTRVNDYIMNKSLFYDFLMVSVLTLFKHNKLVAIRYYNIIKPDWQSGYNFGFSIIKVAIIKFFGLNIFAKLSNWKK